MNSQGAHFQALAGHLVDLYRLLMFRIEPPHSYSKFRNINALRRRTHARALIETGTYLGVTARRCSRVFQNVYTIELNPELARRAAEWLRPRGNVEVIQGDALAKLDSILSRPEVDDVLVFFDGHFSGGATAHGDLAEPAVEEIAVLAPYRQKIRGIIVDDFRCFGSDVGWPHKADLVHAAENFLGEEFEMMIHLDQMIIGRRPGGPPKSGP